MMLIVVPSPGIDLGLRVHAVPTPLKAQELVAELPVERFVGGMLPRLPRVDQRRVNARVAQPASAIRRSTPHESPNQRVTRGARCDPRCDRGCDRQPLSRSQRGAVRCGVRTVPTTAVRGGLRRPGIFLSGRPLWRLPQTGGPGAVGVGWELGFMGLATHLTHPTGPA